MKDYDNCKKMANYQAIEKLKQIKRSYLPDYDFSGTESDVEFFNLHVAVDKAIEALEIQIPKEPSYIDEDCGIFECPHCKTMVYASDELQSHKYCLSCGQAISCEGQWMNLS